MKLGSLKTVQPNSFSKLISAAYNFKNNDQETYLFVSSESLILSFTFNFFAYIKFYSDCGRAIGKIKQNELECCDTAPLINHPFNLNMQGNALGITVNKNLRGTS